MANIILISLMIILGVPLAIMLFLTWLVNSFFDMIDKDCKGKDPIEREEYFENLLDPDKAKK